MKRFLLGLTLVFIIVLLPFLPFIKAQGLDFAIDLLVPARNSYNAGETPQLWARVVNTGSVAIEAYDLEGVFSVISPSGVTITAGVGWSSSSISTGSVTVLENTDNPWTIPTNAEPGLYAIRVAISSHFTGLSRSGQTNNAFSVSAPPAPDFTLSVYPTSQTITQGQSTTFAVTVNSLNGWTAPVSLTVSGLPGDAMSSFSPNPVAPTGTSTLSISTSTSTGQFILTIIGNGDGRQHVTSATLIIQPSQPPEFDFTVSASPSSVAVQQGSHIDACTVTVDLISGATGRVDLSLSGLPSNVGTYGFSPTYGNPTFTSRLSIGVFDGAPAGIYSLTITGSGGGKTRSTAVTLTVTATPQPKQAPTAYIDSVSPNPAVQGQSVSFSGHGLDTDGYITEYNWRSSIDGHLSNSQSFSTSALSIGTHTIYFKVKDNEGLWSEDATIILEITQTPTTTPPPQHGSLRGRVTDVSTGKPISGASIYVSGAVSQTQITGSDGDFAFTLPVGTYTITVSALGYQSQTKSGTVSRDSTLWLNFELSVARPATVEISIERTENIIAGDALKAFFRQVIDWIPGTDLPLVDDQILFKVHGSTNVDKLIVRLSDSTSGIAFRTEVQAKKISETSDTFLAEVTVGRIYSDEEKKRAVVYFVFELASTFVLQGANLPDKVEKIVEKILECVEEEAPEGEPLVRVDVFITEVIPVLKNGTQLEPTRFSYRLETVAEGIAKEDANVLAKILEQYQKSVGCSESNILIITSSGARVGALFENGIFRNVNEVPGAYYSGFGSHPQLVILPSSAGVYTTQVHATKAGDVCVYIWVKDAQELVLSMSEGEVQTHTVEISSDRVYVDAPWWVPVWDQYGLWLVGLVLIVTATIVVSRTRLGRDLKDFARGTRKEGRRKKRKKGGPRILDVSSRPSIIEVTSAPKILEIKKEE